VQNAAQQLPLFSDTEEPGHAPGFSVRVSGRARRLSIKVFPRGKVEVVVPKRTRAADVQAFVAEHSAWIEQARAAFAELHPPESFALPSRIDLPAVGRSVRVRYARPDTNTSGVRFRTSGSAVILSGRTADDALCVAALKRWLAGVARAEFEPRLRALSASTGNSFRRMHVRGQRTCWGSHSSRGTISINYCLLFLEPVLVRYLMIHELCHARHMNHSRRFWRHVGRFEPGYRDLDRRLSDAWKHIPVWLGFY
jgi:predicted metal-dependent hydrolase